MLKLERALATSNPPESGTLKQAPCQDLLFAYKSIYTEINSGILIRGFDPSLTNHNALIMKATACGGTTVGRTSRKPSMDEKVLGCP